MAHFKIHYGTKEELEKTPLTLGYAYFTPDDGHFYIDGKYNNKVQRFCLNPNINYDDLFNHYPNKGEFPEVGVGNRLYVDDSNGDVYVFGVINNEYSSLGFANNDIISGGTPTGDDVVYYSGGGVEGYGDSEED